MLANEPLDLTELVARKPSISFQLNGVEPELRFVSVSTYVNVRRFVQDIVRVEVKLIRTDSENRRHAGIKITYRACVRAIMKTSIRGQTDHTGTNDH